MLVVGVLLAIAGVLSGAWGPPAGIEYPATLLVAAVFGLGGGFLIGAGLGELR